MTTSNTIFDNMNPVMPWNRSNRSFAELWASCNTLLNASWTRARMDCNTAKIEWNRERKTDTTDQKKSEIDATSEGMMVFGKKERRGGSSFLLEYIRHWSKTSEAYYLLLQSLPMINNSALNNFNLPCAQKLYPFLNPSFLQQQQPLQQAAVAPV